MTRLTISLFAVITLCTLVAKANSQEKPGPTRTDGNFRVKELTKGRVGVVSPNEPFRLAEKNDLPIDLHGHAVHSISVAQSHLSSSGEMESDLESEVAILHRSNGRDVLQIVPEKLGTIRIDIAVEFADGGLENTYVDAEVINSDQKPLKLNVVSREGPGTMYMAISGSFSQMRLFLQVAYAGDGNLIYLPAKYAQFRVISAGRTAPIRVDDVTGTVTALSVGHALIETTVRGVLTLTCVAVQQHLSDGSDRTNCRELVPQNLTPPTTGFENALPPPKVKQ